MMIKQSAYSTLPAWSWELPKLAPYSISTRIYIYSLRVGNISYLSKYYFETALQYTSQFLTEKIKQGGLQNIDKSLSSFRKFIQRLLNYTLFK